MYTNEHSRVNNCKLKATAICQERTKSEWLYQTRTFIWFETSIGLGVESFYWLFMRRLFRLRQEWYATSIFTCLNWMLFLNWNLVLTCMTGIPSWQYIRRLLAVKKTRKQNWMRNEATVNVRTIEFICIPYCFQLQSIHIELVTSSTHFLSLSKIEVSSAKCSKIDVSLLSCSINTSYFVCSDNKSMLFI